MDNVNADLARIGKLRRQLGLTQKGLATLAGVSQSLIAKIESNKIDPAYSKVVQITSALEQERGRKETRKKASDIMTSGLASVSPKDDLGRAMGLMKRMNISQLPVFEGHACVGSLSDGMIMGWMEKYGNRLAHVKAGDAMGEAFPSIPSDSELEAVTGLLRFYKAVLVKKKGRVAGIITKADLMKAIER